MADEGKKGGETPPAEPPQTPPATTPGDGDKKDGEERVPRSRLNEVLAEKKKLEDELAERKRKDDEAEASRLAEQGKFKELAEQEAAKRAAAEEKAAKHEERLKKLTEALVEQAKARIKALPEDLRELVAEPTADNVDACMEQLAKVEKVAKKNAAASAAGATGTLPPAAGGGKGDEQARKAHGDRIRRIF